MVVEGVLGNLVLLANGHTTSSALQRRKFLRNPREMDNIQGGPTLELMVNDSINRGGVIMSGIMPSG